MIPRIPVQRTFASKASTPFDDLISYIEVETQLAHGLSKDQSSQNRLMPSSKFDDLVNYSTNKSNKETKADKCIAIRSHLIADITTASLEMNAVALQNTRCIDPAYHFILSWPEHEKPVPDAIFDAAEHAIAALGLSEHQYVVAIHGNTDNMHCHVSINRVHPETFKSHNLYFPVKALHMAARESEIKHGWSHDNGFYIVETNGRGRKGIVLNPSYVKVDLKLVKRDEVNNAALILFPTWHDPEGLESWLKTKVSKSLKNALPELNGWYALHTWLAKEGITLSDSGGGMRLQATSAETGEQLDMALSKGLRFLKREALEKIWGPFTNLPVVVAHTSNLKHLTAIQLNKGIARILGNNSGATRPPTAILARNPSLGRPPEHLIRIEKHTAENEAKGDGGLHDGPYGRVDARRQDNPMVLQDSLSRSLGNNSVGQNPDVRRAGTSTTGGRDERPQRRDNDMREERKDLRAAGRADLRLRFATYRRLVQTGDTGHYLQLKFYRELKSQTLKEIKAKGRAAKAAIPKGTNQEVHFITVIEIDAETLRLRLVAEATFQDQSKSLNAIRTPPLSWRTWLHGQSQLGDHAALSALRGIVYQAQRDAKKGQEVSDEQEQGVTNEYQAAQRFQKVMARLLEDEKKEIAIRASRLMQMRPYEADALLKNYIGIKRNVTGNGNVEFSKAGGSHLFTDRGNRVTFDRVRVSDDDIRMALAHSQNKFGSQLTLTGEDPIFTARMALLADDMGIKILNPELQVVMKKHRENLKLQDSHEVKLTQASHPPVPLLNMLDIREVEKRDHAPNIFQHILPVQTVQTVQTVQPVPTAEAAKPVQTHQERLRQDVLAIDPQATFIVVDPASNANGYIGPVVALFRAEDSEIACFAQRVGRGVFALHEFEAPDNHTDGIIEVLYKNGEPTITLPKLGIGNER